MVAALERGQHLVVDRYAYSGIAFSSSKVGANLSLSWAAASDRGLPAPDLVLFLDISSEDAAKRGQYGEERYEKKEIQDRVRAAFDRLRLQAAQEPAQTTDTDADAGSSFGAGVPWRVVNAGQTVEQVHAELVAAAQETIDKVASEQRPIKLL